MTDIIIVFAYLFIVLLLGVWVGKGVGSSDVYKTGGRQYPSWIICLSLSASYIGGGFTFGLAEKTFLYGLVYVVAIWGFSFKEILVAFLIAPRMKSFSTVLTVGDIMEKAFGTKAKIATGIASVLVCGGIIGAQISACGSIINNFLGLPPAIGALFGASIVIIYATLGGMKSVIAVDILHFVLFAIMLPVVLCFGLWEVGGIDVFFKNLPELHLTPLGTFDFKTVAILFISFFLGETLIPPYVQYLLIGKTLKDAKRGTLWSGVFSLFFFLIVGCIGMVAFLLAPEIPANTAFPYMIKNIMPVGLKGLAMAAMLAVIISSLDSFLSSIALVLSQDILKPLGLIGKSKNKELLLSRTVTLIVGTTAIIISLSLPSAIDVCMYSWQFWTPIVLTPFIASILGIRSSDKAFLISAFSGILGVVLWNVIYSDPKNLLVGTLEGTLFGITLNTLTFILYHRFFTVRLLRVT